MSPAQQLLWIWLLAAALMVLGWLWQRRRDNAGIVDVLWSTGLAAASLLLALTGTGAPGARLLVGVLATAWALRLAQGTRARLPRVRRMMSP